MPRDRNQPAQGRGHVQIADHNSRAILEAVRRNGPMTRLELATLTGLTAPGITNVIRRQMADGLIVEGHRKTQNAQVPSAEYTLRPEGAFAIGVRLRENTIEAILVDLAGVVRGRETAPRRHDGAVGIVTIIGELTKPLEGAANVVGVGIVSGSAPNTTEVKDLPLTLPGMRVTHEIDTVAAVLAERTIGAGVPDNGLIVVLLEDEIRAGLFLHSIPFAGVRGRAGRLGEMRTGKDRLLLNDVCSAKAFETAIGGMEEGKMRHAAINAWVENAGEHLLDAVMALAGFVAPGKIVLAGDLPQEIVEALISRMVVLRNGMLFDSPVPVMPPVAPAAFLHDSVLLGAAFLPFFDVLLPTPFGSE